MKSFYVLVVIFSIVYCDIYFHNPRGSNNRFERKNANVKNNKRLFDSQNNDRGGYNSGNYPVFDPEVDIENGQMIYYKDSILQLEWTNQHQCGGDNSNCDIIIQYMCDNKIRDGMSESKISDKNSRCAFQNCDHDLRFGLHEEHIYHKLCALHKRSNLFTADQKLEGDSAIYTRQNPQGTRYGYECPEERDYYPFWGPSPWKDIVVMTDNEAHCTWYQEQSQNVKERYYCKPPDSKIDNILNTRVNGLPDKLDSGPAPFNETECAQAKYQGESFEWTMVESHDIAAPDCIASPKSKDNHNGNGEDGYPNHYNWKVNIAELDPNKCVFRIRYNISTGDYDAREDDGSPKKVDNTTVQADIARNVGLTVDAAIARGYVFENNPIVQPFSNEKLQLQLAINTAEFGRTFQDRTHACKVIERPENVAATAKIYNVNVRGKRGNIVQVYPAVEYDFVPNKLNVSDSDYVHFQWTGSETNAQGADRSNVLLLGKRSFNINDDHGDAAVNFPENLTIANLFGEDMPGKIKFATADNSDTPYYNHQLIQLKHHNDKGNTYNYFCSKNNQFSNRSQKGKITVSSEQERDEVFKDAEESLSYHIRNTNWKKK